MIHWTPLRAALALVFAWSSPAAGAADSSAIGAAVDRAIRPLMAQYDVPGVAIGVTIDGKAMFFNYGVASRQSNTPVSEATLFELGSISKLFTATLASYAVVQGKLSLADHPGKYLPQLKGTPVDEATVLHLGTYTAGGLPLQFPDEIDTDARIVSYFRQWKADAAPGTQRRYSNPSLGLFGHVAARALKTDFADAIETQLLPQLGLAHSFIRVPAGALADYAWGYNKANEAVRVNPGAFAAEAYGIKSSAADMIAFVQANIAPGRLAAPMRRAVEGTHVGYFQVGDMVQGLGWEQYAYPVSAERLLAGNAATVIFEANAAKAVDGARAGPTLFNKTGSTNGFGAYVAFVPEKGIGIVMLANRNFPIPARVKAAHAILEQLAAKAP